LKIHLLQLCTFICQKDAKVILDSTTTQSESVAFVTVASDLNLLVDDNLEMEESSHFNDSVSDHDEDTSK